VKADRARKTVNTEIAIATIRVERAATLRDMEVEKARIELENTRELLGASVLNSNSMETSSLVRR